MAMARDGHYNSDSPVFYKNYELSRRGKRTVFSSRYYSHDVLDTIILSVAITCVRLTLRIILPSPSVTFHGYLPSVLLHRLS